MSTNLTSINFFTERDSHVLFGNFHALGIIYQRSLIMTGTGL